MNCDSGHKLLITTLLTTAELYSISADSSSASLRNPHKFNIKPEMDGRYYNLWSTDNDKTVPNDDLVIKSVYDPSPVGYSLPASNAFTGFTMTGVRVGDWYEGYILTPDEFAKFNVKGNFDKGWNFYCKPGKQGSSIFFLASGFRYYNTGSLDHVTADGYYWLAVPASNTDGRFLSFNSITIGPMYNTNCSFGMSVRSAEEKKLKYELDEIANSV